LYWGQARGGEVIFRGKRLEQELAVDPARGEGDLQGKRGGRRRLGRGTGKFKGADGGNKETARHHIKMN